MQLTTSGGSNIKNNVISENGHSADTITLLKLFVESLNSDANKVVKKIMAADSLEMEEEIIKKEVPNYDEMTKILSNVCYGFKERIMFNFMENDFDIALKKEGRKFYPMVRSKHGKYHLMTYMGKPIVFEDMFADGVREA